MDKDTELLRLEQFVEKLLRKFSELKDERDGLLQTVTQREETIAQRDMTIEEKNGVINERDEKILDLEVQLDAKNTERNEISNKVSSIMEQIESWELSLESEGEFTDNQGSQEGSSSHDEHSDGDQQGENNIQNELF